MHQPALSSRECESNESVALSPLPPNAYNKPKNNNRQHWLSTKPLYKSTIDNMTNLVTTSKWAVSQVKQQTATYTLAVLLPTA